MQDLPTMMEQLRMAWGLTPIQFIAVMFAAGALIGFLFGLIPYLVGVSKNQKRLGLWALLASTVSGALLPAFVVLIVVAVFLVMILRASSSHQARGGNGTASDEHQDR